MRSITILFFAFQCSCSSVDKNPIAPTPCLSIFEEVSINEARESIKGNWKLVRTSHLGAIQNSSLEYEFLEKLRIFQNKDLAIESDYLLEIDLGSPVANQLKVNYFDELGSSRSDRLYFGNQFQCIMLQRVSVGKIEFLYFQKAKP